MSSPLRSRTYGILPDGRTVDSWTLTGKGGLVLEAITFGGIVTRLLVPGRNGKLDDVVLGLADLESYVAGHPYFGAIVGRVAGRIAGAAFSLDSQTYRLASNESPNHLHGGLVGFDKRIWNAVPVDRADGAPSLRLSYFSPDGEEGYPGNVNVAVTYTVTEDNTFLIETEATSDRATPLNLTNHSYFNLAGEGAGTIENHRLTIYAGEFVPVHEDFTLTGRLEATTRQGNDFQQERRIGDALPMLFQNHGELYSLPAHAIGERLRAARLEDPMSGRVLTVSTSERYLQLYAGSGLTGAHTGKSGKAYSRYAGVCLECEGYPDAAHAAMRKDTLIYPEQTQRHATAYAFSVNGAGPR